MDGNTAAKEIARMKIIFPNLSAGFFDILLERAKEKGFTNERLTDAVNNVIENCRFPTPSMAEFISFDKRIKLFSYNEVCDKVTRSEATFEDFEVITIDGEPFRVNKKDFIKYNLLKQY